MLPLLWTFLSVSLLLRNQVRAEPVLLALDAVVLLAFGDVASLAVVW